MGGDVNFVGNGFFKKFTRGYINVNLFEKWPQINFKIGLLENIFLNSAKQFSVIFFMAILKARKYVATVKVTKNC